MLHPAFLHSLESSNGQETQVYVGCCPKSRFPVSSFSTVADIAFANRGPNSASAATVVRACYFDRFLARVDYVWGFSDLALWSVIEGLIGITIGSVPSLKPMFKRFKFLAITSSHRSNSKKASDYQHFDSYAMQSRNKGKNQTRVITVAEESDSVKELVTGANIVVSQEFRHEEEYEYHDRKPASSV